MTLFVLFPYLPLGIHYQIFAFFFCADNCVHRMISYKKESNNASYLIVKSKNCGVKS